MWLGMSAANSHDSPLENRRVLFVLGAADIYGAERSLLPVVHRLDSSWKPYFLVNASGPLYAFLKRQGFPVYRLPLELGNLRGVRVRRGVRLLQLLCLLYFRRIRLVHVNQHFFAYYVWKACSLLGIPMVVHVRNMIERRQPPTFCKYQAIICISQAVRDSLIHTGGVPEAEIAGRLWIIPDGRDLAPFRAGNGSLVRAELGLSSSTPLIGMAARITPMKNQDTFLRIAALVKERLPAARFLLVGAAFSEKDEEYLQQLRELTSRLGLENDVTFAGYRHDMPDVLAAMDCFLHPSHRGAFVSVLIEAMASGVPIVASDVDGIPECLGRDGAGLLLPPDDVKRWADSAVNIITDKALAACMAAKARERAGALFDIAPLARQTIEILETVYANHGAVPPVADV
jgi:glycosyltransferase involved in cell wall biosynthesis